MLSEICIVVKDTYLCIHTFDQIKAYKTTMSRSVRKTKIFGITTADTEKQDKKRWNRTFRKVCKKLIRLEKEAPTKIQGVTSVWDGAKDGKKYYRGATKKDMRK